MQLMIFYVLHFHAKSFLIKKDLSIKVKKVYERQQKLSKKENRKKEGEKKERKKERIGAILYYKQEY